MALIIDYTSPSISPPERIQTALWVVPVCDYVCGILAGYWTLWTQGGSSGKKPSLCFYFPDGRSVREKENREKALAIIEGEGEHAIYWLALHLQAVCKLFSGYWMATKLKTRAMIIHPWPRPALIPWHPSSQGDHGQTYSPKNSNCFILIVVEVAGGHRIR